MLRKLLALACLLPLAATAYADTIVLKNGSKIMGTVKDARDGKLFVDTDFAGTLEIVQGQVAAMETATPVTLQMADGTVLRGQPIRVEDQKLLVDSAPVESYAIEQLLRVNPEPWELGEGYRWTGLSSLAFVSRRGNAETDEYNARIESKWRSVRDRFYVEFSGQTATANGEDTAEKWLGNAKYDYFLENDWYAGVNATAEHDKFADIDLRSYIGPFVGKTVFTDPIFLLEAEVGLSYVSENFFTASDNEYPGANWRLNATSNYLGDDVDLYFRQNGIWDLEESANLLVTSTFGLGFPILNRIEGAAEVLLNYNSGAQPGVEKLDQTYRFRIGYSW